MKKFLRLLKKTLIYSTAGILILVVAGAIYQWGAEKNDQKEFPPPGKMINVGDHVLHIQIKGKGNPVVVLEAASDGSSANWQWVIDEIAKITTVCAYDRAGHGWSDPTNDPRDALHIAAELHTLLLNANIEE